MDLPGGFEERMRALLKEEYGAFRESLDGGPVKGLRANTLKLCPGELTALCDFELRPVPWAREGFYYADTDRPGISALHEAGLYYIQEPSAMAAAGAAWEALCGGKRSPGMEASGFCVLDLCAAPGGKSTQLAAFMDGKGLLVSNEIHPARAKILSSNVERMGIGNAVVANETPERLSSRFSGFFDLVMVDAPCSGEGMFRKDEEAVRQWSVENVAMCAARQREILTCAARMTAQGGVLVYSTCTFEYDENEGNIDWFLKEFSEFEEVERRRLWPHKVEGEGHFAAVLRKKGAARPHADPTALKKRGRKDVRLEEALKLWKGFSGEMFSEKIFEPDRARFKSGAAPLLFGDNLYLCPAGIDCRGLKIIRPGLHLGTVRKGRFEPSHALSHALKAQDARHCINFKEGSPEAAKYMAGGSLTFDGWKGWTLVCVEGFGLGWGKASGGVLKNHYPKGLRRQA